MRDHACHPQCGVVYKNVYVSLNVRVRIPSLVWHQCCVRHITRHFKWRDATRRVDATRRPGSRPASQPAGPARPSPAIPSPARPKMPILACLPCVQSLSLVHFNKILSLNPKHKLERIKVRPSLPSPFSFNPPWPSPTRA